jgi:hypothetical protein
MSSAADTSDNPVFVLAFQQRLCRQAIAHRAGRGIESLTACKLAVQGVFRSLPHADLPPYLAAALRDPSHKMRFGGPSGPMLFVRVGGHVEIVEVGMLLLWPDRRVRHAALKYIEADIGTEREWLTPFTKDFVQEHRAQVFSQITSVYETTGIAIVTQLRNDLFAHLAGLRQSLEARYVPGVSEYFREVLRPRLLALTHLRPPVWKPSEQREEIQVRLEEFARCPSLGEAMRKYIEYCGYLPLAATGSALALADAWESAHAPIGSGWSFLKQWSSERRSIAAQYHVLSMMLARPDIGFRESEGFWDDVANVVDPYSPSADAVLTSLRSRLQGELTFHFVQHVESLHPGQDGESIACCAHWLAEKTCLVLGDSVEMVNWVRNSILPSEATLSSQRWCHTRSPVAPSPLRSVTLFNQSTWSMSMAAQLGALWSTLPVHLMTEGARQRISGAVRGYVVGSQLTRNGTSPATFAFEESKLVRQGLGPELNAEIKWDEAEQVIALRDQWSSAADLDTCIQSLLHLDDQSQSLALLSLLESCYSSTECDQVIEKRFLDQQFAQSVLNNISLQTMSKILEVFVEVQLRHIKDVVRVPHMFCKAMEESEDIVRMEMLLRFVLVLSIANGLISPIQRALRSKWKDRVYVLVKTWRDNALDLAKLSEPWVSARIRSVAASISQFVGTKEFRAGTKEDEPKST